MNNQDAAAVEPIPAATVLLVRDKEQGGVSTGRVEVFMEKRHLSSTFVGGAYVFPGGRVDPSDSIEERLCCGLSTSEANSLLGTSTGGLEHFVATLRECFEEAGVLLAYGRDGELLSFQRSEVEGLYREARDQLNAGALGFEQLLIREGLQLATDRMYYWSHWITPVGEKRRYDTRFFLAEAPKDQIATHDDWELTSSEWVEPAVALEKAMAGEWFIIFPTLHTLTQLAGLGSTAAVVEWAQADHLRPINQPKLYNGGPVLPGDEGYEQADENISGSNPRLWMSYFQRER